MTETSPVREAHDASPAATVGAHKRLFAWILPAHLVIFMVWGAVPGVLLPLQVQGLGEDDKLANLAIITTIGAIAAMIAQPVGGAISDRTRSRLGRRSPWIIGGTLIGALSLVGMSLANTLVTMTIAWVCTQIAYNLAQGPLSAVMPDRIPSAIRGSFAAVVGIGTMAGSLGGQIFGASLAQTPAAAYLLLAGLTTTIAILFVLFNPDASSRDLERTPFRFGAFLRGFWVNPVAHPDFFWVFTSRMLLYIGFFAIKGYLLYILMDYIGLGDAAIGWVPILTLLSLAGILLTTAIAGPMSDRIGRRKPFVLVAALVVAVAIVIPALFPTPGGMIAFAILAGLGFGAFQAVDTALISQVLPSEDAFAKDLGIVNIAATLPQTIAPAVAGTIVVLTGGFTALFPLGMLFAILGGLAVLPVRSVR